MTHTIIDLSHPLDVNTPPFPGDSPVEIQIQSSIPTDAPAGTPTGSLNVSRLSTGVHVGTHMDAPFHFYNQGQTIDQIPLAQCMGRALLLDLRHTAPQTEISQQVLLPHEATIRQTRKVILNLGWATHWQQPDYFTHYPVIAPDAAHFLVACGVELVGVDTPSVDYAPNPTHFILLGKGVLIVENLTHLDRIPQPQFQFIALPLKLTGRDASPVRVVAILEG